jgi:arylsulfatase A-like enzyme
MLNRLLRDVALGSVCLTLGPQLASSGPSEPRPNILFLFADDQSHEALSAYGSEVQTPNLDRLVANGVSFANAYNQGAWHGAVCVASRTMLITGRFLWNARRCEQSLDEEVQAGRLWPQYLSAAGYDTYMSGKWHIGTHVGPLFDTFAHKRPGMPNQTQAGYNRPQSEADYATGWKPWDTENGGYWKGGKHWSEVLGDDGVDFLQRAATNEAPFFMYLAFNAPHDPRQSPKEFVDRYSLDAIKVPKNFLPEYPFKDDIGCSSDLRDERLAPFPRTEFAVKVHRQEYYAIITHMDEQIGRILDALEKSGKKDSTYIFFTADHGLALGHHGLMGKQNLFEHSAKAPLIVCGPDFPKGKRIEAPVYIQDIMPTTLELAGTDIPDHVQFKSLLPLISGDVDKSYEAIYGAYKSDLQRMVRKDKFKLICYPKIKKSLLFDLDNDPDEMVDLSLNSNFDPIVKYLHSELRNLQEEMGDSLEMSD